MDQYINAIQQSVAQNNAWSAEQAQKQMDFQREMSNTAHQREIADLQAAGLNPVLSAKLGGASTPSGAMATGDTSGTSALVDLLQLAMQTANSASVAAARSAGSSGVSAMQDNSGSNVFDIFATTDGDDGKPKPDYEKTEQGMRKAADMLWTDKPRTLGQYVGNMFSQLITWVADGTENARNTVVAPAGTSARKAYDAWHPTENSGQSKKSILDNLFGDKIVAKSKTASAKSGHSHYTAKF